MGYCGSSLRGSSLPPCLCHHVEPPPSQVKSSQVKSPRGATTWKGSGTQGCMRRSSVEDSTRLDSTRLDFILLDSTRLRLFWSCFEPASSQLYVQACCMGVRAHIRRCDWWREAVGSQPTATLRLPRTWPEAPNARLREWDIYEVRIS